MLIDLNIKELSSDTKIWRIYPGTKKNFIAEFIEYNCVFLELPSFAPEVRDNRLRSYLESKLARSKALAEWHLLSEENRSITPQPSDDLEDYTDPNSHKKYGAIYNNYNRIFKLAKLGDIVMVPEDEGFNSILYIGEITSNFSDADRLEIPDFGGLSVPIRRVRWLRKDFLRRKLDADVNNTLGGRRAVKEIEDIIHAMKIFRIAYTNFTYQSDAQYYFDAPSYSDDPADTIPGIRVLQFALAAASAVVSGDKSFLEGKSFTEIVQSRLYKQYINSFEINFASPGGYRVWVKDKRVVLLALALIAGAGYALTNDADPRNAELTNSQVCSAECDAARKRDYEDLMSGLGGRQIEELKSNLNDAQRGVDLKTKAKVSE